MSPDETPLEPTVPVPAPGSEPAGPSTPAPVGRGRRVVFAAIVGAVVILVLLGVGGYLAFQKFTGPDRSTPAVVADQFLEGALLNRDVNQATPFACGSFDVAAFIGSLPSLDPRIAISWGDLVTTEQGDNATVRLTVRYAQLGDGVAARDFEDWQLGLVDSDGWRVCSVTRPSLNP